MYDQLLQLILGFLIFVKTNIYEDKPRLLSMGNANKSCYPNMDNPLLCDSGGLCLCCLENGTALSRPPSPTLKTCLCNLDRVKSIERKGFGHFIPQCDDDGSYSKVQYHSNGRWWCADPITGVKITEQQKGVAGVVKHCDCLIQKYQSKAISSLLGAFVPSCEADGSFSPIQFHPSIGLNWCVDPLTGTNITAHSRTPMKSCNCPLKRMHEKNVTRFGHYKPQCETDGSYSKIQRHSSGRWWCADPLTGSNVTGQQKTNEGPIKYCECLILKYQHNRRSPLLGDFDPACEPDGSFNLQQHHPSTGLSWCADPVTGTNISCDCPIKRMEARNHTTFGRYIPQCEKDGSYSKKQLHSNGRWWCADSLSGANVTNPQKNSEGPIKNCDCPIQKYQHKSRTALGLFVPECTEDGSYAPLQSHPSNGLSWCVEPVSGKNVSEKALQRPKHCNCFIQAFQEKEKHLLGNYIPQCDSDGLYSKLQLHGSTGFSWCADPTTGKNVSVPSREKKEC